MKFNIAHSAEGGLEVGSKLKSCPFCGEYPKVIKMPLVFCAPVMISCSCGARFIGEEEQDVIKAWNRRTKDECND